MKEVQTVKKSYFEAIGRRKTSSAKVRISPTEASKNVITINNKDLKDYFPTPELRNIVNEPLEKVLLETKFKITIQASGGGIHSQAEAVKHGLARAVILFDSELRKSIKTLGFLTRDSRAKERRKFGLKKARKAPQWSKR